MIKNVVVVAFAVLMVAGVVWINFRHQKARSRLSKEEKKADDEELRKDSWW